MVGMIFLTFPAQAKYKCSTPTDLFDFYMRSGFGVLAVADMPYEGAALIIMLDKLGNYKLIGMEEKNACVLLEGSGWHFMINGKA